MTGLIDYISFPSVEDADEDGLLAMGGNLSPDTLISAYKQGIFPWFNENQPILWWSPDPRLVLFPNDIKISRSLAKVIRKNVFTISYNKAFEQVIKGCADTRLNAPESGTWISHSMYTAYCRLHQLGYAHSIEVWQKDDLVGGLYGIAIGNVFYGESMFSRVSNASKVALVNLCQNLQKQGFQIIDCQVTSTHLISMGAVEISRDAFLKHLKSINIQQNSRHHFTNLSTHFL